MEFCTFLLDYPLYFLAFAEKPKKLRERKKGGQRRVGFLWHNKKGPRMSFGDYP